MVAQRNSNYRPRNPFILATPVAKKLKVLLYGPSGSGKTIAALTFPKVAYINAEGGADMYAGRDSVKPFHWFSCKTISELETALDYIEYDSGSEFETLVIDPITVFYDVLKEAGAKTAKEGTLGFREWALVNNRMKAVYNRLTNLPVHVVVIGRESIEYEGAGNNLRKVGVKPDADKALVYIFDFIVRMTPEHTGIVEKSRGVMLGNNGHLPKVTWEVFEASAKVYTTGNQQKQQSEQDAAEKQAEELASMTEEQAKKLVAYWREMGLKDSEMLTALGVERFGEFKGTDEAAAAKIKAWHDAQIGGPTTTGVLRELETAFNPTPEAPAENPDNGEPEATPEAAKSDPSPDVVIGNASAAGAPPAVDAPATDGAEAVGVIEFVSERVKYVGPNNNAHLKFWDASHAARRYGRDMLRDLGPAFKEFADSLKIGPDSQDAVDLPQPVRVWAEEKTTSAGIRYWNVIDLKVEGGAK